MRKPLVVFSLVLLAVSVFASKTSFSSEYVTPHVELLTQNGYDREVVLKILNGIISVCKAHLNQAINAWGDQEAMLLEHINDYQILDDEQRSRCDQISANIDLLDREIVKYQGKIKEAERLLNANADFLAKQHSRRCDSTFAYAKKLRENQDTIKLLKYIKAHLSDPAFATYLKSHRNALAEINYHVSNNHHNTLSLLAKHHMLVKMLSCVDCDNYIPLESDTESAFNNEDANVEEDPNTQAIIDARIAKAPDTPVPDELQKYMVDTSDVEGFLTMVCKFIEDLIGQLEEQNRLLVLNEFNAIEDLMDYHDKIVREAIVLEKYIQLWNNQIEVTRVSIAELQADQSSCMARADEIDFHLGEAMEMYQFERSRFLDNRDSLSKTVDAVQRIIDLFSSKVLKRINAISSVAPLPEESPSSDSITSSSSSSSSNSNSPIKGVTYETDDQGEQWEYINGKRYKKVSVIKTKTTAEVAQEEQAKLAAEEKQYEEEAYHTLEKKEDRSVRQGFAREEEANVQNDVSTEEHTYEYVNPDQPAPQKIEVPEAVRRVAEGETSNLSGEEYETNYDEEEEANDGSAVAGGSGYVYSGVSESVSEEASAETVVRGGKEIIKRAVRKLTINDQGQEVYETVYEDVPEEEEEEEEGEFDYLFDEGESESSDDEFEEVAEEVDEVETDMFGQEIHTKKIIYHKVPKHIDGETEATEEAQGEESFEEVHVEGQEYEEVYYEGEGEEEEYFEHITHKTAKKGKKVVFVKGKKQYVEESGDLGSRVNQDENDLASEESQSLKYEYYESSEGSDDLGSIVSDLEDWSNEQERTTVRQQTTQEAQYDETYASEEVSEYSDVGERVFGDQSYDVSVERKVIATREDSQDAETGRTEVVRTYIDDSGAEEELEEYEDEEYPEEEESDYDVGGSVSGNQGYEVSVERNVAPTREGVRTYVDDNGREEEVKEYKYEGYPEEAEESEYSISLESSESNEYYIPSEEEEEGEDNTSHASVFDENSVESVREEYNFESTESVEIRDFERSIEREEGFVVSESQESGEDLYVSGSTVVSESNTEDFVFNGPEQEQVSSESEPVKINDESESETEGTQIYQSQETSDLSYESEGPTRLHVSRSVSAAGPVNVSADESGSEVVDAYLGGVKAASEEEEFSYQYGSDESNSILSDNEVSVVGRGDEQYVFNSESESTEGLYQSVEESAEYEYVSESRESESVGNYYQSEESEESQSNEYYYNSEESEESASVGNYNQPEESEESESVGYGYVSLKSENSEEIQSVDYGYQSEESESAHYVSESEHSEDIEQSELADREVEYSYGTEASETIEYVYKTQTVDDQGAENVESEHLESNSESGHYEYVAAANEQDDEVEFRYESQTQSVESFSDHQVVIESSESEVQDAYVYVSESSEGPANYEVYQDESSGAEDEIEYEEVVEEEKTEANTVAAEDESVEVKPVPQVKPVKRVVPDVANEPAAEGGDDQLDEGALLQRMMKDKLRKTISAKFGME